MAVTINLNLSTTDANSIKNPKEGFSPLEHLQISHRPLYWLHWDCQIRHVNHTKWENTESFFTKG